MSPRRPDRDLGWSQEILIGQSEPWERHCVQRVIACKLLGDDPWFGEMFAALDAAKVGGDSEAVEKWWRQILERFWATGFSELFEALGLPMARVELSKKDLAQLGRYRKQPGRAA